MGRFFDRALLFEWWSSGEGDWCKSGGGGGRDGCGGDCESDLSQFGGAVEKNMIK